MLWGLVTLFALLLAGLWVAATAIDYRGSLRQAERDVANHAHLAAHHAGAVIDGNDAMLGRLALQLTENGGVEFYRGNPGAWHDISVTAAFAPIVRALILVDRSGRVVRSSRPEMVGRSVADRPLFLTRQAGRGEMAMGMAEPIAEGARPLVILTRALTDEQGAFDGMVMMGLDVAGLLKLVDEPDCALSLLDGEGRPPAGASGETADPAGDGGRTVLAAEGKTVRLSLPEGISLAAAHRLDRLPLAAMVSRPERQALAAWSRRTWRSLAGLVLGLAVCLVLGLAVRRSSAREMRALVTLHHTNLQLSRALAAQEAAAEGARAADAAKSRFLDAASHDLRQPIQAVGLYLDTLQQTVSTDFDRRVVYQAQQALAGTGRLLDALAEVGRLDAGLPELRRDALPLGPLLEEILAVRRRQAAAKGLELRLVPTSAVVVSDRALLRRMIDNLLDNALRFTAEGRVLVGCRLVRQSLRVEVWDTGIGIPADQHEAVFEDFYQIGNQARDRSKGIGLGLAVVRRAARRLGHGVTLSSVPGRGTVFALTLPLLVRPREMAGGLAVRMASAAE